MSRGKLSTLMDNRRAMTSFETIGYAILALVVIVVVIVLFTKLAKNPTTSVDTFNKGTQQNAQNCIDNPASCQPFGKTKTAAPEKYGALDDVSSRSDAA